MEATGPVPASAWHLPLEHCRVLPDQLSCMDTSGSSRIPYRTYPIWIRPLYAADMSIFFNNIQDVSQYVSAL